MVYTKNVNVHTYDVYLDCLFFPLLTNLTTDENHVSANIMCVSVCVCACLCVSVCVCVCVYAQVYARASKYRY